MVVLGLTSYFSLPRESAPEIRRPLIFITTIYPGVSPKDMESLITEPIEYELDGLKGLEKLTSTSYQGMSQIVAEFNGDIDVELALRRSKERVDLAKPKLPSDAEDPIVKELNFSDQPFMIATVSHPEGLHKIESYVDYLEEEIEKIHGIQDVVVSGNLDKELEIAVDPERLRHYGFSVEDIKKALGAEHRSIPGGTLETDDRNYTLSVSGEMSDPEEFKGIVISAAGKYALLEDLATVRFGYSDPESIARIDGLPAVSLAVKKRGGENMLAIVDEVKKTIAEAESRKPHGTQLTIPFDESENVRRMVSDLENNILSGLILVLLVTLFFLGPINATFVSLAIPFSMLISFFILALFGITLNMVVLFSLVIALGMLVDNGIVIVENIYRHAQLGTERTQAAIDGTREIALPISTSTLTTILAFFPIIFMPDIMGEFMSYLPKTVIIVLSSSLLVGLTITTAFCSRFLRADHAASMGAGDGLQQSADLFGKIQILYSRVLRGALRRPWLTMVAMVALVFSGIILNAIFGREPLFFPELDPKVAFVKAKLPAGTPIGKTDGFTRPLEEIVQAAKGSRESVQTTVGAASSQGGARDSFRSEIRINYKPFADREVKSFDSIEDMRHRLADVAGAAIKVEKMEGGPPTGNDISFQITGEEYPVMGEIAERILRILRQHRAVLENIDSDFEAAKPEYQVTIDREKAGRLGVTTRDIASTIRTALSGSKEGIYKFANDEYDINLRFQRPFRSSISDIAGLEIVKEGKRIPLSALADITRSQTTAEIKREERKRAISVFADYKPDVLGKVETRAAIDQAVAQLQIPEGYQVGQGEGQAVRNRSTQFLLQAFMIALFLIFLVLVIQFNSVTQPMIILASVFLSLGGVFWGLFLTQQKFVIIMSGIGVISLAGVVVNNAIVLIDFINQLRPNHESMVEAIVEASLTRLRPVLLTAITTVIGLLPMAAGISFDFSTLHLQLVSESSEWWAPMAWTIIFGLSFATVLTLVVIPVLMLIDYRIGSFFGGGGPKSE